jgi:hypothetical protein
MPYIHFRPNCCCTLACPSSAAIEQRDGVPAVEQRLLFAGRELMDNTASLADGQVPNGGKLRLLLRLVGD